jgi:hypothetical protein
LYVISSHYFFSVLFSILLTDSVGQTSLPESCPVCDHTPISPDLCKPNKALRTTLKAFLRTEEKKREKERPAAPQPSTSVVPSGDGGAVQQDNLKVHVALEEATVGDQVTETPTVSATGKKQEESPLDISSASGTAGNVVEADGGVHAPAPVRGVGTLMLFSE